MKASFFPSLAACLDWLSHLLLVLVTIDLQVPFVELDEGSGVVAIELAPGNMLVNSVVLHQEGELFSCVLELNDGVVLVLMVLLPAISVKG